MWYVFRASDGNHVLSSMDYREGGWAVIDVSIEWIATFKRWGDADRFRSTML